MKHTRECIERHAALEKWKEQFPNHCTACMGRGGHTFYESHGLPGPSEQMWEPCSCVENGKCPRCATDLSGEEQGDKCPLCSWDPYQPQCAPNDECWCHETRRQWVCQNASCGNIYEGEGEPTCCPACDSPYILLRPGELN